MPLLPPLVLEVGSGPQVPTFRNSTYLDLQVGLTRNLGVRHGLELISTCDLKVTRNRKKTHCYVGVKHTKPKNHARRLHNVFSQMTQGS